MTAKTLIFMRHAEAVDPQKGLANIDRELTRAGREQARRAAMILMSQLNLIPDQALVSTARRTQQTYEEMRNLWGSAPKAELKDSLFEMAHGLGRYNHAFDDLAEMNVILEEADPQAQTLLILGHAPVIPNIVAKSAARLPQELMRAYPTATAVIVNVGSAWNSLALNSGTCRAAILGGTELIEVKDTLPYRQAPAKPPAPAA